MKASGTAGTVTGFFTYTGPSEGTQHDEIDVEVLGDSPSVMQINYWTSGVQHPVNINLGFDASSAEHKYAFEWLQDSIKWYVDGALVHTETGSNGAIPATPGAIMLNLWATTNTNGWSSDTYAGQTTSIISDCITHLPYDRVILPDIRGRSNGTSANELLGRSGNISIDKMAGRKGDDIYFIDHEGDRVTERPNGGLDEIHSSLNFKLVSNVENLILNTGAVIGTGNKSANIITGNESDNILNGKEGNDTLTGNAGADIFLFDTKIAAKVVKGVTSYTNVDSISDFVSVSDDISLDKKIFKAYKAAADLTDNDFASFDSTVGGSLASAPSSTSQHFLYDTGTGNLYYDVDGSGSKAAVQFATLTGHPALSASDLHIV